MKSAIVLAAFACMSFVATDLVPVEAQAQDAGALLGGLAGGMIGGVIAGSMYRSQPGRVVVYRRSRAAYAPRHHVARTAAPHGNAAVINASSDPFAKSQGVPTTSVSNK